jgi:hypothetical protein
MCASSKALQTHAHTSHVLCFSERDGFIAEINMRFLKFQLFMACDSSLFEFNLILIHSFEGIKSN